ncbi:MAG TPA: hypothetical protein VHK70_10625 [Burkholderiaceae bacterium]|nr:hypothetical protein [Burkholderiaceae bacterium]
MKQRSWDVRKDASDPVLAGVAGRRGCKRDRAETVGDQTECLNFGQVALEA